MATRKEMEDTIGNHTDTTGWSHEDIRDYERWLWDEYYEATRYISEAEAWDLA